MDNKYGRKKGEVNLAVDVVTLGITDNKLHILLIKGKKHELDES
jgi:hypothetical protein